MNSHWWLRPWLRCCFISQWLFGQWVPVAQKAFKQWLLENRFHNWFFYNFNCERKSRISLHWEAFRLTVVCCQFQKPKFSFRFSNRSFRQFYHIIPTGTSALSRQDLIGKIDKHSHVVIHVDQHVLLSHWQISVKRIKLVVAKKKYYHIIPAGIIKTRSHRKNWQT